MIDKETLKNKLTKLRILVVGDLMLDEYMRGTCDRISPEAPVPIVDIKSEEITLGGAGNVLKNLSSFGVKADILSVIGADQTAELICNELIALDINTSSIYKDRSRVSSKKTRVMAANHQLIRIDKETKSPIGENGERFILDYLQANIHNYNLLLISDYLKGVLTNQVLKSLIALAQKANVKIIVDPKGNDYSKYWGVDIIKPNRKELALATGLVVDSDLSLRIAAKKLKEDVCCDTVIVTLSEEGMAIYREDLEIIPTKANAIFDVTGAGDTVLATLGICIAAGMELKESCIFANHAAAIVVSKVGSAVTTVDEVLTHIQNDW